MFTLDLGPLVFSYLIPMILVYTILKAFDAKDTSRIIAAIPAKNT